MRRLFAGLLMAALAVLPARADDKPAVKEGDTDISFKELKKQFEQGQKQLAALAQDYRKAKTDEERKEIEKKFNALQQQQAQQKYPQKFVSYAETHLDNADSLDALMLALQMSRGPQADKEGWGRLMAAFKKGWAKKPQIKSVVRALAGLNDDASDGLVRAVLEENPDRKLQGAACKVLLQRAEATLKSVERLKDDEQLRERFEKQVGKDFVKQLLAKEDKAKQDKKKYDQLLVDKYADTILDLSVGKKAPEIVSEDLEGNKVKLSDLRGKVVVLDLWATWCGPCKSMIPHEREMVARLKDKPFVLVSISADEQKKTLTDFLKETKMPWTHWWSGTGGVVEDWEVDAFPTLYVLDTKGVIRHKFRGVPPSEKLDEAVDKLLEETGKKKE